MAYVIEILSIGEDLYAHIEAAAKSLNQVQGEFIFKIPPARLRSEGIRFSQQTYNVDDIFAFLEGYRERARGHRPFVIGFVSARLRTKKYENAFGSHRAENGLATATLYNATRFVSDKKRFCCYYLVRYALSFLAPSIKNHEETRGCFFDKKEFKPDIRASLDKGALCDECSSKIQGSLNAEIFDALKQMFAVVSRQYPYALVMKGGGVKGLAFVGALAVLEKHFSFDSFVGTSAGGIAALLLASGYSPGDLETELRDKNLSDFLDSSPLLVPFNLLLHRGCYHAVELRRWLFALLQKKLDRQEVSLRDLPSRAVLYATGRPRGTIVFDSKGERKDADASFAARCSMSIPVLFVPQRVDGRRVYDGGLRENFPVSRFLQDNPNAPFIALYLGGSRGFRRDRWMPLELLDIWLEGEESTVLETHKESVVIIDPRPVSIVDFGLSESEKDFLVKAGRAAALRFIRARQIDDGPSEEDVLAAEAETEELRSSLVRARRWRWTLIGLAVLVVSAALVILVVR